MEVITQKNQVRIAVMNGPLGLCLVATEKDGKGGGTRFAGSLDGFGGSEVQSFTIDVDRMNDAIRSHSFLVTETTFTDEILEV